MIAGIGEFEFWQVLKFGYEVFPQEAHVLKAGSQLVGLFW
jgi:hypothetical protein